MKPNSKYLLVAGLGVILCSIFGVFVLATLNQQNLSPDNRTLGATAAPWQRDGTVTSPIYKDDEVRVNYLTATSTTGTSTFANGVTISGNLGVGSTTPIYKLSITGGGTGSGINFQTTGSTNIPGLSVLDNGRVAIGTTTGQATLTIENATLASTKLYTPTYSAINQLSESSNSLQFGTISATPVQIYTNNSLRARFTSTGQLLMGTSSSDYSGTNAVFSKGAVDTNSSPIGLVGEAVGGFGLYGFGKTTGATLGNGVTGLAKVSASADTGTATGIAGFSNDTHAGGSNIAVSGNASGGASNYSFYGFAGTLYNVGNLTIDGTTRLATGLSGLLYANSGTVGARTLTGTTNEITVTNGDGVSGNPTIDIPNAFGGMANFYVTGGGSWSLTGSSIKPTFQQTATAIGIWNGSQTLTADRSFARLFIATSTVTEASSGNHALITSAGIAPMTITGAAATISDTATLYIQAAMSATVSGANYSLWVDDGPTQLDGNLTVLGTTDLSASTVKTHTYPAFSYSTSTSWTGTTTIPLGPAFVAESWSAVKCFTDTGTVNVSFFDGTNRMNMFNASTTVGTVTLSSNNTFTASEKRYVDVGTPASSPTKISCTVDKIVN